MSFLAAELLGQLIDAHAAALEMFAAQWSPAPADVVQEAFIELASQTEPPPNLVAWLYRVVRNLAYDEIRAESRRRRHESAAAQMSDRWVVPDGRTAIGAREASVALRELPIELREVLVARIWCGLTFEQIAEITQTSVATAFRRHKQALALLRTRLGIACPGEEKTKT
jgi:RNA polymerase sigma-70 factor (ECF subfamily)